MIGTAIRNRRQSLGLSLRAFARMVAVDVSYLSRVESGIAPPSDLLLEKIAHAFGCDQDEPYLLAGRLPRSISEIINRQPYKTADILRMMNEMCVAEPGVAYGNGPINERSPRAIEEHFEFEQISEIAEVESWRKEIYRPIYHVHKWWAQRLGSVFRAAIIGAASTDVSAAMRMFYEPARFTGLVVFDPFMGSGTTLGEAQKLGCTVIGRDINPVAYRAVRVALGPLDRHVLHQLFRELECGVAREIRQLYRTIDSDGNECDVLYYFWVKTVKCPSCSEKVDLFSNYVFASHAYKKRYPDAKITCPECSAVLSDRYDSTDVACSCGYRFNPQNGPARRTTAECFNCSHEFPIAETIKQAGGPPRHRLYAKLVLRVDGTKEYLPATSQDERAYRAASERLRTLSPSRPEVAISDGHNTRQILNYGYTHWHELFNDRQLLALTMLADAIRGLPDGDAKDALAVLFSGVLEFNNMFASYKGEGTGAVRHMFSHHILKPERTPIEANPWGTPKSSGAFSTLYKSRLMRALDYRDTPFELAVEYKGNRKSGTKVFGTSPPMGGDVYDSYPDGGLEPETIYISCGDSSDTDLPDDSVDLVVTDPPFFDNVHYSELADFFFVWQELYFGDRRRESHTTRQAGEVQDTDAIAFADKLCRVFRECHRVLRDNGLLVFSYHHSRDDGWIAVAQAVMGAGFTIVQSHPVKSEMSVAAPKSQTNEPIDLDVLMVCRKRSFDLRNRRSNEDAVRDAAKETEAKVRRFNSVGRRLSRNDLRVVLLSQLLVELSAGRDAENMASDFDAILPDTRPHIERMARLQVIDSAPGRVAPQPGPVQLDLLAAATTVEKEA